MKNIWGKGGAFETALANKLDNQNKRTGVLEQNADSMRMDVKTDAFEADTNRIISGGPPGGSSLGLRGFGKGAGTNFLGADSGIGAGTNFSSNQSRLDSLQSDYNARYGGSTDTTGIRDTDMGMGMRRGGPVLMGPITDDWRNLETVNGELQEVTRGGGRAPIPDNWQNLETVNGELREVSPNYQVINGEVQRARPNRRQMAPSQKGYAYGGEVSQPRMRQKGYAYGGEVSQPRMRQKGYAYGGKVSQPGMRKGGTMQMPEQPGVIGNVAKDTGEDTQEIVVREGEYLLNPPTVRAMGEAFGPEGGGDPYENGVRFLNQFVKQATGEEPGPEPVGKSGSKKPGFQSGGFVDDYGNLIDPKDWSPAQQQFAATDEGRRALLGNTRATQLEATKGFNEAYDASPEGQQTKRLRAEAIVEEKGYGKGTGNTGNYKGPRADLPLNEGSTPKNTSGPKPTTPSGRPTFFGSKAQWAQYADDVAEQGTRAKNYVERGLRDTGRLTKSMQPLIGRFSSAIPLIGTGFAAHQLGTGIQAEDYGIRGDVAKGGGDLAATAALLTPAAPAAAAYFAGRAGEEIGGEIYRRMEPTLQENIGGFVNAKINDFTGGRYGVSEADQAEYNMNKYLAGGPSPARSSSPAGGSVATAAGVTDVNAAAGGELTATEAEFITPEGRSLREFNTRTFAGPPSNDEIIANYLANNSQVASTFDGAPNAGNLQDIPGVDAQYAGQYGGQEVLATVGPNGEPTFTGLRSPQQVEESLLRQQQKQQPPTYKQQLDARIAAIESGATNAGTRELQQLRSDRAQLEAYEIRATASARANARANAMTPGELTEDAIKVLSPLFMDTTVDPDTGEQIDVPNRGEMGQFIRDVAGPLANPQDGNAPIDFFRLPAAEQADMVEAYRIEQKLKRRTQRGIRNAGSDTILAPGISGRPLISRESRPGTFADWLNPNSDIELWDSIMGSAGLEGTDLVDVRIPGENTEFLLDAGELVNDDQQIRQYLQRNR